MSKLHTSADVLRALARAGFVQVSQRGSHLKLRKDAQGLALTVIVPHPARELPRGTFDSILKQAGMTHEAFDRLV
ncbi:MAG: type II toxin-antitoxin system HicA family toxin [Dehalococcoidia bacterium]